MVVAAFLFDMSCGCCCCSTRHVTSFTSVSGDLYAHLSKVSKEHCRVLPIRASEAGDLEGPTKLQLQLIS